MSCLVIWLAERREREDGLRGRKELIVELALFVFRIVSRLSVWEWARPAPQRLPDAAERVSERPLSFPTAQEDC